jgi:hypothetical protein
LIDNEIVIDMCPLDSILMRLCEGAWSYCQQLKFVSTISNSVCSQVGGT